VGHLLPAAAAQLHLAAPDSFGNFTSLPRIRSESPTFDLHHPEVALQEYPATAAADGLVDAGDDEGRIDQLHQRIDQGGDLREES
jgi:cytochrome c oxidase subunit 1